MKNYINYIGIDKNLPENIKYFKEELFGVNISKKPNLNPIHTIISTVVDYEIISTKLVNTDTRISNEGQKLSGKKCLIELSLSFRLKYVSNTVHKNIYILKSKKTKIMYIVLPTEFNNETIESLVRKKKFNIDIFIEDIYTELRDEDNIYIRTLLLANFEFIDRR